VYNKLTEDDTALVLVFPQTGFSFATEDKSLLDFINNLKAIIQVAAVFELPTVVGYSGDGSDGPLLPFIKQMLPGA